MSEYLVVPKFKDEDEEAQWWFDNRDRLGDDFARAAKDGKLTRGTVARSATAAAAPLVLEPADATKARALAKKRGVNYHVYLQALIHEALEREEKLAG